MGLCPFMPCLARNQTGLATRRIICINLNLCVWYATLLVMSSFYFELGLMKASGTHILQIVNVSSHHIAPLLEPFCKWLRANCAEWLHEFSSQLSHSAMLKLLWTLKDNISMKLKSCRPAQLIGAYQRHAKRTIFWQTVLGFTFGSTVGGGGSTMGGGS